MWQASHRSGRRKIAFDREGLDAFMESRKVRANNCLGLKLKRMETDVIPGGFLERKKWG